MTRNNNPFEVFKGGWEELENAKFTDNEVDLSPSFPTNTFAIKPDGTEIYVLEIATIRVVQTFSLTIPYDPNSLGTLIRSFPIPGTDDIDPIGITFQKGEDEGTKMFIGGQDSKTMLSYALPDPFNTDSIVDSPAILSLSTIPGILFGSTFSRDGDFLFTTSQTPNAVHSFPLPTPWDITSNVSAILLFTTIGDIFGIDFKPEGDKMYLVDLNVRAIVEFDLSTVYDISTAVANGNIKNLAPDQIFDINFRSTGKEVLYITPVGIIKRLHLDEQWDISTASHFTNKFFLTGLTVQAAISWKPDGTKFFVLERIQTEIFEYTVPDRWNVTNAVEVDQFDVLPEGNIPQGMWWRPDGTRFYIIEQSTGDVNEYTVTNPWDLSVVSFSGNRFDLGPTTKTGIYFRADGIKMFVISITGSADAYDLGTAWDITTAVLQNSWTGIIGQSHDIFFSSDGRNVYRTNTTDDTIERFTLQVPWSFSVNPVFADLIDISAIENGVLGFCIRQNDGMQLFITGSQFDSVISLDMSLEFNNSLITNFGDELETDLGETLVYA